MGSQLIRRNDEIALLTEKARIQQSALAKGESQYRERLEDLQLLKNKIADLQRQLQIRSNEAANTETLKNEVWVVMRVGERKRVRVYMCLLSE